MTRVAFQAFFFRGSHQPHHENGMLCSASRTPIRGAHASIKVSGDHADHAKVFAFATSHSHAPCTPQPLIPRVKEYQTGNDELRHGRRRTGSP